jgi:hypothetical protein
MRFSARPPIGIEKGEPISRDNSLSARKMPMWLRMDLKWGMARRRRFGCLGCCIELKPTFLDCPFGYHKMLGGFHTR